MKRSNPLKRQNRSSPATVRAGSLTSLRRPSSSSRSGLTVASRCTWSSILGYGAAFTGSCYRSRRRGPLTGAPPPCRQVCRPLATSSRETRHAQDDPRRHRRRHPRHRARARHRRRQHAHVARGGREDPGRRPHRGHRRLRVHGGAQRRDRLARRRPLQRDPRRRPHPAVVLRPRVHARHAGLHVHQGRRDPPLAQHHRRQARAEQQGDPHRRPLRLRQRRPRRVRQRQRRRPHDGARRRPARRRDPVHARLRRLRRRGGRPQGLHLLRRAR